MDQMKLSKTLAYHLRHRPDDLGLTLDAEGWVGVDQLLVALYRMKGLIVTLPELEEVVRANLKQRYSIRDGKIRANQGHTVEGVCAVVLTPIDPPILLYHGTTVERWPAIQTSGGLSKMGRHHVHLSGTLATAQDVAGRHRRERPLILEVLAGRMSEDGFPFYRSENGVWLTERVPLEYLVPVRA